jgi:GDPmannose 4,6-dehydratase
MVMTENIRETLVNKKIEAMNILNIRDVKNYRDWNKKSVIVTGVTGQDGSYMVDYLLNNTNYQVFGGVRRLSVQNHENIHHIVNPRFNLINFDLTDSHSISRLIENVQPDYFLNFAAQSFVAASWDFSRQTWETNTTSVLDILEAIRLYSPKCRIYNAGSSEEFGNVIYSPQDELHPPRPRSPYAASKSAARQLIKVYRESYNLYAVQGWLFNHESQRRGSEFVTRKITKGVARIYHEMRLGEQEIKPIELGNLDSNRDWSDAEDFIDAIWKMMNRDSPKDYVIASGETHSIREFVEESFKCARIENGKWVGSGVDERYLVNDIPLIKVNPEFYRPAEVDLLIGDSSLAREELKWSPKVSFKELVNKMVKHDITTK